MVIKIKSYYNYIFLFLGISLSTFLALNIYTTYLQTTNTTNFKNAGNANASLKIISSRENSSQDFSKVLTKIIKSNINSYIIKEDEDTLAKYVYPLKQKYVENILNMKILEEPTNFIKTNTKDFSLPSNKTLTVNSINLYKYEENSTVYLNFDSEVEKKNFINALNIELRNKYEISEIENTFILDTSIIIFGNPFYIFIPILFLMLLIIISEQKNKTKKIRTLKVYGASNFEIFNMYFKKYISTLISGLLLGTLIFIILPTEKLPLNTYYVVIVLISVIVFIVSSSLYFYIRKNKVTNLLKKVSFQQDNVSGSYIIKVITISFLLIFISLKLLVADTLKIIDTGKWKNSQDINLIKVTSKSLDRIGNEKNYELYKYLNSEKAILASRFENLKLEADTSTITKLIDSSTILVNNNYLVANNIIDSNGNQVLVDEVDEAIIILIPEIYADNISEITENLANRYASIDIFKEIRAIIIKNNQDFFSYNLNVEMAKINHNPIVRVVNNSNSIYLSDYSIQDSELFIPKFQNDKEIINEKIVELHLESNYSSITTLKDLTLGSYDSYIYFNGSITLNIFVFTFILIILVIYSAFVFTNLYFKEQLIKSIYGMTLFQKNSKFYLIIFITYLIFIGIGIIFNMFKNLPNAFFIYNSVLFTLFVFELLLSTLMLWFYQRNEIYKYAKGEFL